MFQINQNNLHLLLPGKISWLVDWHLGPVALYEELKEEM